MAELAPVLCTDCAEYHVQYATTRYGAPDKSIAVDRPLLIDRIQKILIDPARPSGFIEIVIAGAADTGILATCAHASAVMGDAVHSCCRFTVIDRCRSPLKLCTEFSDRHGLQLRTVAADLVMVGERFDADLIVSHSLLRYLKRPQQADLLKKFHAWLKPQGRVVMSQSLRPNDEAHFNADMLRHESRLALAKAAVTSGAIKMTPEAETLVRRLRAGNEYVRRPGEIGSARELRDLMLAAGLREHSIDVVAGNQKLTPVRVLAIFGSSRDA
jgi:hypothetical protein